MKTQDKPMTAVMLLEMLAGELYAHPSIVLEAIKADPDTLTLVRQYGNGLASYEQVKERVIQIF